MATKQSQKNKAIRMPPQNIEAEQSVLGSLMLDQNSIHIVVDVIKPEDFYQEKHNIIYETMLELHKKKEPIDMLSLPNRLKEKKVLDDVGGNSYLADLVNSVPSASNAKHYAEIVRKKKILRDLIGASDYISHLGYDEESDIDDILDQAEKKIFSVSKVSLKQKFESIKHILSDAWERFDKLHKSDGEIRGVSTGFAGMDNLLAGLQNSDLIILAARPSVGKSALSLDIARNVAKSGVPVGFFSLEMASQQLVDRLIASEAHIDSWKLRTGRLSTDDEFSRLRDALDTLSKAPIFIDDESNVNIIQMRAKARRLQAEHGLGLIVVDYLQLMLPRQKTDNMVQQMTEISRSLKGLAKELDVPVLALSQLSRAVEMRQDKRPKLHDLRDSGSIEQDADVVMFIYRDKEGDGRATEILIEKHRNGPTGKVDLYFNPEKVCFTDVEKGDFGNL